jgi:hypothetical protein
VGGALLRLGLAQQFLDLLPRQTRLPEDPTKCVARNGSTEDLADPLLKLLYGPVVARQAFLGRVCGFNLFNDLLNLFLGKK